MQKHDIQGTYWQSISRKSAPFQCYRLKEPKFAGQLDLLSKIFTLSSHLYQMDCVPNISSNLLETFDFFFTLSEVCGMVMKYIFE